jgi:hypothetical protein
MFGLYGCRLSLLVVKFDQLLFSRVDLTFELCSTHNFRLTDT